MSKIGNFVRSIFGTVNKSDVEMDLQESLDSISVIQTSLALARNSQIGPEFINKHNIDLSKRFYQLVKRSRAQVSLSFNMDMMDDLNSFFLNLQENGKIIMRVLNDYNTSVISTNAISSKDANILRAVPHIYFIVKYTNDLINWLMANEINAANNIPTNIPKVMDKKINGNLNIFVTLLTTYGDNPNVFRNRIDKIPSNVLTKEENSRIETFHAGDDIVPGAPDGFIGSPIYTIRSISAKWQADRYHLRQDEKKLFELRLNYLQSIKAQGNVDASVEKDIEYLQNKINKINYELDKMEADI